MADDKLGVYVMEMGDIRVGLTGNSDAPIVLVVEKAEVGFGLSLDIALNLHDALCGAIGMMQNESASSLEAEFAEIPKNKLN